MRFWTFDPNTCRFERASKQAALHAADVAVARVASPAAVVRAIISAAEQGRAAGRAPACP